MYLQENDIIDYLKKRIDQKRLEHSINTSKEAVVLARIFGADEKKAQIAGLLHDVAKGKCRFGLVNIAHDYNIKLDEFEISNPELAHGKIGAQMVRKQLGIKDEQILSAIRWHTTGRAGMTMLEKVIYIADIIEPCRKFEGVENIRKLAVKDIDKAVIMTLEYVMKFVHSKGLALHPKSIEAYKYYKKKEEKI